MKYTTLLPFLSDEDLQELAEQIISGEVKGVNLVRLYPFLGKEKLSEIVNKLIKEKKIEELRRILPFISRETVGNIHKAFQNGDLEGLKEDSLLPFLSHDQVKEMFRVLIKKEQEDQEKN